MIRRLSVRFTLLYSVISLLAIAGAAQQPATGIVPFGTYGGGPFDTVNLSNLDVHFSIPIFGKAGKGLPFSYSLGYDGLVWSPVASNGGSVWTPVSSSNWGWRAVTEAATGYMTYSSINTTPSCPVTYPYNYEKFTTIYSGFVYHDPSGAAHAVGGSITEVTINSSDCGTVGVTFSNLTNAVTADNSGYIINIVPALASWSIKVSARGGLTYVTPNINHATGPGTVSDPNGNQITINSSYVMTDTLNMTALSVSGDPPTPANSCAPAVTYTYTAPGGFGKSHSQLRRILDTNELQHLKWLQHHHGIPGNS